MGGCPRTDCLMTMDLNATEIFRHFKHLSIIGQVPTNVEWEQIEVALYEVYPQFRDFMYEHRLLLTSKEQKTCLLIRMGFNPTAISHMLGTSAAYISIMRSEMIRKLFGCSMSLGEFDKRIREIG